MGLGKVIGLGILFAFLLLVAFFGVIDALVAVTQGSAFGLTGAALIAVVAGSLVWVVIAGVVGWSFIKAIKEYRASRVGKPVR